MILKIVSIHKIKKIKRKIGNTVLALFKNLVTEEASNTIEDSVHKIQNWIHAYLDSNPKADTEENESDTLKTYFEEIIQETLYEKKTKKEIHPLLIKIANTLLPIEEIQKKQFPNKTLDALITAIKTRQCFDEHKNALRQILIYKTKELIDKPLQPIVEEIYEKMERQINKIIHQWETSVFKGYIDDETVHSQHIIMMTLDDLYETSGGTLKDDIDTLIPRTNIAKEICKSCFHKKLTIKNLLSENEKSWKKNLAEQLSIGTGTNPSNIKLSINDLIESKAFLNHLIKKGALSKEELKRLKDINNQKGDYTSTITGDLFTYTNTEEIQSIIYNEKLAARIIEYIDESINKNKELPKKSGQAIESRMKKIDKRIKMKIIEQYFLQKKKKEKFTYDEIECGIGKETNSEYFFPFLKPYLSVINLMIANCEKEIASKIFEEIIWPNKDRHWTFDCMLMMMVSNRSAFLKTPIEKWIVLRDKFENSLLHIVAEKFPNLLFDMLKKGELHPNLLKIGTNESHETPLHRLTEHHPEMIQQLIEIKGLKEIIMTCINNDGNTPLHFLAEHNGEMLYKMVIENKVTSRDLMKLKNNDNVHPLLIFAQSETGLLFDLIVRKKITNIQLEDSKKEMIYNLLFWITKYRINDVIELIKQHIISLETITQLKDSNGVTLTHLMSIWDPETIYKLINIQDSNMEILIKEKDAYGNTSLHRLAENAPNIINRLVKERKLRIEDLGRIKNKANETILHIIAEENINIVDEWIINDLISGYKLGTYRNFYKNSIYHLISVYNPSYLLKWIQNKKITLLELGCCINAIGMTPLHGLAKFSPDILYKLIALNNENAQELKEFKDNKGKSVYHMLGKYHGFIIMHIIENQLINETELSTDLDNYGNTPFHYMAQYNSLNILSLAKRKIINISKLSNCHNRKGYCIYHILAKYNPNILIILINEKITSVNKLNKLTTSEGTTPIDIMRLDHIEVYKALKIQED